MGVKRLWDLLEPCGHRISIEALSGRRYAVDASGWLFQFIKAMRDERGELLRDAHLVGFFRRICRLLFHRIKPVFIFDGATPALKRQTVIARRRQREKQNARLRRTAEKLLLNQLKQHALAQVASQSGETPTEQPNDRSGLQTPDQGPSTTDALHLEAEVPAEENEEETGGLDLDVDQMIGDEADEVDAEVLSQLPPSLQLEVMLKLREAQVAANRERFAAAQGNPQTFSQVQMAQYLKATAFRQKVNQIKDSLAAPRSSADVGRRIAGLAGREYVLHRDQDEDTSRRREERNADTEGQYNEELQRPIQNSQDEEEPLASASDRPIELSFSLAELEEEATAGSEFEWEDIPDPSVISPVSDSAVVVDVGLREQRDLHWRERAARRQKFWSMSQGFRQGRSLARWGSQAEAGSLSDEEREAQHVSDEDEALQRAIQDSLQERQPDDDEAGPSGVTGHLGSFKKKAGNIDEQTATTFPLKSKKGKEPAFPLAEDGAIGGQIAQNLAQTALLESPDGPSPRGAPLESTDKLSNRLDTGVDAHISKYDKEEEGDGLDEQWEDVATGDYHPSEEAAAVTRSINQQSAQALEEYLAKRGQGGHHNLDLHNQLPSPTLKRTGVEDREQVTALIDGDSEQPPVLDLSKGEQKEMVATELDSGVQAESSPQKKLVDKRTGSDENLRTTTIILEKENSDLLDAQPRKEPKKEEQGYAFSVGEHPIATPAATMEKQDTVPEADDAHGKTAKMQDAANIPAPPSYPQQLTNPELLAYGLTMEDLIEAAEATEEGLGPGLLPEDAAAELDSLQCQAKGLRKARRAQGGQADAPTDEIYAEIQELLQMFGIPYIVAPGEAEAQCAWLDSAGLVDGVITDDNDAFLFGARTVYRHIFSASHNVEEYRTEEIEEGLGLNRDSLISLALLLGSDYTPGVHGIGIVNAAEVVHAFQGLKGLAQFKEWVVAPDETVRELVSQATSGVNGSTASENEQSVSEDNSSSSQRTFQARHKGVRRTWELPADFPSAEVVEAYEKPRLDTSRERFLFGRPDEDLLRAFGVERLGWTVQQCNELLLPVLREWDRRERQLSLEPFLAFRKRFAKIQSKRLQQAVKGIAGKQEALPESPKVPKKKARRGAARGKRARSGNKKTGLVL